MSAAADALNLRCKISDPRPAFCSGCFQGASEEKRFVDFNAAVDRGTAVTDEGVTIVGVDDLHLCEDCVRVAAEALDLKTVLHSRQLREIRRLEAATEHWKAYAVELEQAMLSRPEKIDMPRKPRGAR